MGAVRILLWWASNFVALWVAAALLDAVEYGDNVWVLVLAALVFGLVNLVIRPVVILLALPAVVLTLGLALLLVNAFMLYVTDWIVPDFEVDGFGWAVVAAIIVWAVNMALHALVGDERGRWRFVRA
ncbi:MAG TPA: phage holin family protein [Gaiellaceae bacterium]|nr:phage holin family protein [Gaiellaceae bacterium]